MGDWNHFDAPNATHVTHNTVVNSRWVNGWEILQMHIAPNALYNSSARFDAPKCDEDTRVKVTDEIMGFIKNLTRNPDGCAHRSPVRESSSTFPYVILIDGLDECKDEPDTTTNLERVEMKYRAEDRKAELLSAIKNYLLNYDLPFRVFIASRPELPICTALGAGGSLHRLAYHIQLSDQYDATEDMRRYLRRRFQDIGLRIGQPDWFTESNIETLLQAGSGQFVSVATVFKYVSERRASPVHMLKTVLNWIPGQVTRPFEALDMLYTNILSNAKETYEAVDAYKLHSLPDKEKDMSASEKCLRTAIAQLDYLKRAVAIDDEILDFTHKGGWHKIDMVLSKPSVFSIIFSNDWGQLSDWMSDLGSVADD
ncbi:hypothetical protein H1R20_g9295, partial [Candolleomyces eurysporus]